MSFFITFVMILDSVDQMLAGMLLSIVITLSLSRYVISFDWFKVSVCNFVNVLNHR